MLGGAVVIDHDSIFGMEVVQILGWCGLGAIIIGWIKLTFKQANKVHKGWETTQSRLDKQDEQIALILKEVLKDHGSSLRDAVDNIIEHHEDLVKSHDALKDDVKEGFKAVNDRIDYHLSGKEIRIKTRHLCRQDVLAEEYGQGVD